MNTQNTPYSFLGYLLILLGGIFVFALVSTEMSNTKKGKYLPFFAIRNIRVKNRRSCKSVVMISTMYILIADFICY